MPFFIFFKKISIHDICMESHVNALSGLCPISTWSWIRQRLRSNGVSMPSRAYTSFLPNNALSCVVTVLAVSMPSRAYTSFLHSRSAKAASDKRKVSMPSRAYTSFLHQKVSHLTSMRKVVSMPSRAYTSFLQYPFKNLGFMRFPEPVFADICQNILTVTVFRAC